MGHVFSSLLLALSANVDNLPVGVAYGVKKQRISFLANLPLFCHFPGGRSLKPS
ncbi:hypothetical protein G7B40_000660 [Aetokthonos hydrillicola Thurmond2011]|jgi:putative Mn2+ efflux pump MntP|uniref:Uncharacterized protein n=1 Tax=Aetokthonos hydrillicola Thurmond2011 TaxID=2712845 RepID=A0AAP5I3J2_9CYAN|nr:hypothetical protein [Aetokthonos hydrillicola]MBO3460493.1 hypothetical protein [Aetokthonos hydrillicola CCALA 1050]MBW4588219.1 hypothetical protein [Aetokthonos hydrillicola CCALA 1050]MDR9893097.1 hypothetical protein [Aetokthonos hydrillicola Thurmond2011]